MCGIAGFIGGGRHDGRADLVARHMADAIARRGPDDHGVWVDRDAGAALAHRRLSIVDLTPAGHQPMLDRTGRYAITFNGEIYNHAELRVELEHAGVAPGWRGHCDTEVLLEAIAAWGVRRALERSVGMFAFALWDKRERTLVLARDRLGEKPLYYGWAGSTFVFGSELSALTAHPDWEGEIDRDALGLLVRLNYIPAPHAIYKGIRKVPPGTYFVLQAGARAGKSETYWDAGAVAADGVRHPFTGSADEAVERTDALMREALKGQMMADVPLGAFLSGGIDSSTVVALMQAMSPRPVRTFSIGFKEPGYDEAPHAKAVARHLGTDHTELYVTMKEAMAVVPQLPSLYSEPFADVSQIPTFLVSELARRHVTVALSGDGGDELFSGYTRYAIGDKLWRVLSRVPRGARRGAAALLRNVPAKQWDAVLNGPLRLLPERSRPRLVGDKLNKAAGVIGLDSADDIYDALISLWPDPAGVVVGASGREMPRASTHLADPVRRMMHRDLVGYLPDDILVKVDRASMAVGLEARVPLLDHRLVEFTWTLPLGLLRRDGASKWPLRRILSRHIPPALTERPKMGFGVPIDSWLRGGLRDWAESLLDARRLADEGLFHPEPIRATWQAHLDGHRNM
ncbi:MAG TPA: asparagine synthase (glutamine-hydrolyzing), partial [Hyphomicrobium sp.]